MRISFQVFIKESERQVFNVEKADDIESSVDYLSTTFGCREEGP